MWNGGGPAALLCSVRPAPQAPDAGKDAGEYPQSWSQDTRMGYFCDAWLLLAQVAGAQETV